VNFDLEMTDELLATTRAVRRRLDLDRPVPREIITECLELAVPAPTGGDSQGWRWLVIDDAETRAALADIYRAAGAGYLAAAEREARDAGDDQKARVYSSANYLVEVLHRVPVHVIPCIEGRLPDDAPLAMTSGLFGSIFPAVWSFQLALRSRGLGSALTTVHLFREAEAAALLGIPENVVQVALLPVAYTKGTDFRRAKRPPASSVTHWNRW